MSWVYAERIIRTLAHAALMAGAIWIGMHPEYAPFAPVLQYLGNSVDGPR